MTNRKAALVATRAACAIEEFLPLILVMPCKYLCCFYVWRPSIVCSKQETRSATSAFEEPCPLETSAVFVQPSASSNSGRMNGGDVYDRLLWRLLGSYKETRRRKSRDLAVIPYSI